MKKLLLALLACAPLFAQPACVSVTDTIYSVGTAAPILMNGTIDLALGYSAGDGSFIVTQSVARQTIAAGALNTCLAPGNYQASYSVRKQPPLTGVTTFVRYWTMPLSGGPYDLSAVETSTPATPILAVAISQLTNGGASNGQCLAWSAGSNAWIPAACGSGGGATQCNTVVAFSSTPVFDFSTCPLQTITLTGSVAPVISNPGYCKGITCFVVFVQGSSMAYSVTWGASVHGGLQLGGQLSKLNTGSFVSDGTLLIGIGAVINQ